VKRSRRGSKVTADRTAFIFLVLIAALALVGAIPLSERLGGDDGGSGAHEARVTFDLPSGDLRIYCDIADDDFERTKGLMGRSELGDDEGMLFVYGEPRPVTMWMKDTSIPLDIVFISEDMKVIRVYEAPPGTGKPDNELELYPSGQPCLYVVEMNMGLADEHGIGPGTHVEIRT